MIDALVLGAGVTGLTAAFRLRARGKTAIVFETEPRVGGCIRTHVADGYVAELGPSSLRTTPLTDALCRDLGIDGSIQDADARAPRYIARDGRAVELRPGPGALVAPIVSWRAKAGVLRDLVAPPARGDDDAVAPFFTRRFGPEIARYLAGPFVSGVYAGDPSTLSVRSAFPALWEAERRGKGVIRGMLGRREGGTRYRRRTASFPGGLAALTQALETALGAAVERDSRATALARSDAGWSVRTAGGRSIEARHVICTLPEAETAALLAAIAPGAAEALREIRRVRLATLSLGYPEAAFARAPRGFGVLVPRGEGIRVLGCLFTSSLFPGRAPVGESLLSCFVGGALDPGAVDLADDELLDVCAREVGLLLGATGRPRLVAMHRWQGAIPQYDVGHHLKIATIEEATRDLAGLHLCGNWRDGVSLAERIAAAESVAASV